MELLLEAVALFALKLVHEHDDGSPLLRDDPAMEGYDREVFGLLMRQGNLAGIQLKLNECLTLALDTLGGADTVMGRELQRLVAEVRQVSTFDELNAPLSALKNYLKAIL